MSDHATGDYAPINGLRMYYETHGTGDPVVLIHGGLLTIGLSWANLIPVLAERHTVIAVELQGHGRTANIDRPFTPQNNAADIVALLDHLGIARATIIGHSTGAATALELAVHHGDRVDRVVSLSGSVKPDAMVPDFADPETLMSSPRIPTPQEMAAMRSEYERLSPAPQEFEVFQQQIASAPDGEGFTDEELAGITAPVLEVLGDLDFVPFDHLTVMQQLIPDCRIGVLPGTTHTEVPTRADLLAPMLKAFLTAEG